MSRRDYKKFSCDSIVHVYNRGNNKEKIFYDEQDYKAFLFRVGLALGFDVEELNREKILSLPYSRIRITDSRKNNFKLHAFCLMPNHFHFLLEQCSDIPVSKLISKICTSYAKYINQKYKRVGHIFQDKFKAVNTDSNAQLMWSSSYIHMNAIKDGLVKDPSEYKWSSYTDYISKRNLPIITKDLLIDIFDGKENFIEQTLNFSVKDGL